MTLPGPIATLLAALLLVLAGDGAIRGLSLRGARRWVLALMAGCLLLHVELSSFDLLGIGWSPLRATAPLAAVALLGMIRRPARNAAPRSGWRPGWGDLVAAAATGAFALWSWRLWISYPDFVYHWGLKARRFLASGHVDYEYLARHGQLPTDYPNLYPELLAFTSMLGGAWRERGLLLWSALFLAMILAAMRASLADSPLSPLRKDATVAIAAAGLAAFGIGHLMAGSPDWMVALALVAAVPALIAPPSSSSDLQIGLCAAFGAMSKVEGVPLALFLIAAQLARSARRLRLPSLRGLAFLVGPTVLLVGHWAAMLVRYDLYMGTHEGTFSLDRLRLALPAMLSAARSPEWLYLPAALLLLPLLRLRGPGLSVTVVVGLELLFLVWTYASLPVDTNAFAHGTFQRALLHLLPAALLVLAIGGTRQPLQATAAAASEPRSPLQGSAS